MSLMAGLVFGGLSFCGAYNVTYDSKDIKVSLREYGTKQCLNFINPPSCFGISLPTVSAGLLSVVMGMRYKKSGKLMPAGIMSGLRSESTLLKLRALRSLQSYSHSAFAQVQFLQTRVHL